MEKWGRGRCRNWCESGRCQFEDTGPNSHLSSRGCDDGAHPKLMLQPACADTGTGSGSGGCLITATHSVPEFELRLEALGFPYSVPDNDDDDDDDNDDADDDDDEGEGLCFESKAYLNVRYAEKDEAKGLGAWWDPDERRWYVPPGRDVRPFEKWSPRINGRTVIGETYDSPVFLSVTFQEKDEAKALGAWFDGARRQWYVPPNRDVRPFAKWRMEVDGRAVSVAPAPPRRPRVDKPKKAKPGLTYPYRMYLDADSHNKDELKSMGAQFDKELNRWLVPPQKDVRPFAKWYPRGGQDGAPPNRENKQLGVQTAVHKLLRGGFHRSHIVLGCPEDEMGIEFTPGKKRSGLSPPGTPRKADKKEGNGRDTTDERKPPAVVSPEKKPRSSVP